jgi:hypothetical protein
MAIHDTIWPFPAFYGKHMVHFYPPSADLPKEGRKDNNSRLASLILCADRRLQGPERGIYSGECFVSEIGLKNQLSPTVIPAHAGIQKGRDESRPYIISWIPARVSLGLTWLE